MILGQLGGLAMDLWVRVFRLFRAEMDFRVRSKVGFEGSGFEDLVFDFDWETQAVENLDGNE